MSLPIRETYRGVRIIQSQDRVLSGGFWHGHLKAEIDGKPCVAHFKMGDEQDKQKALQVMRSAVDDIVRNDPAFPKPDIADALTTFAKSGGMEVKAPKKAKAPTPKPASKVKFVPPPPLAGEDE